MSTMVMLRSSLLFDYSDLDEEDMEMAALSELDQKSLGLARCCVCGGELTNDMVISVHSETGDIFCMCKEHMKSDYHPERIVSFTKPLAIDKR